MYRDGFMHIHRTDPVWTNAILLGGIRAAEGEADPDPAGGNLEEKLAEAVKQAEDFKAQAEAAKAALEDQKITVTVDGEEKTMTFEEARTALSKIGGADKKFRDAAELKKQAERGMRIDALFSQINKDETPDPKLVSELSGLLGLDPNQFVDPAEVPGKKDPMKKITLDDLHPDIKTQLEYDAQRNIEAAERKIYEEVRKGVDKDQILGKMNDVAKETGNKEFLEAAAEVVHEDVLRKIRNGGTFGTEMVESSLQAARARFKRFGIPEKVAKPKTLIVGAGHPGGTPLSIQPDEPVERVDSSEATYADNFVSRVFQKMAKGAAADK